MTSNGLGFVIFETAIGWCGLAWGERGVVGVQLPEGGERETRGRMLRRFPGAVEGAAAGEVRGAVEDIVGLLRGEATDLSRVVLDMDRVPLFHRRVYDVARRIPPGKTLTYGDIAHRLGQPHAARAVGQALGRNPFAIVVPCHRVLASGGRVGGFSATGGIATKLRMLTIEGAHQRDLPGLSDGPPAAATLVAPAPAGNSEETPADFTLPRIGRKGPSRATGKTTGSLTDRTATSARAASRSGVTGVRSGPKSLRAAKSSPTNVTARSSGAAKSTPPRAPRATNRAGAIGARRVPDTPLRAAKSSPTTRTLRAAKSSPTTRASRSAKEDAAASIGKPTSVVPKPARGRGAGGFRFDTQAAVAHLRGADPLLRRLIDAVGPFVMKLDRTRSLFFALAEAIVYQQLTAKAAATIFGRVRGLFPGGGEVFTPEQLLAVGEAELRGAGLSRNKMLALRDLATRAGAGEIPAMADVHRMDDEAIVERLTQVRGIGRWTVHMLLMFRLGRADVLPADDYGVRQGFGITFRKKELPAPKEVLARGERWRPYRSVASWYLWRAVERARSRKQMKA